VVCGVPLDCADALEKPSAERTLRPFRKTW
jgi:hypothetical protein